MKKTVMMRIRTEHHSAIKQLAEEDGVNMQELLVRVLTRYQKARRDLPERSETRR